MKFATSLRLLGELIPATECDYESFKNLVLICPHCKQSVYLIGEHQRSATTRHLKSGRVTPVRESLVTPHFTHHSSDTDLCEVQDRSISPQIVIGRATVARNQRAAIFRNRFWEIFCSGQYLRNFILDTNLQEFDKRLTSTVKTGTFAIFINSVKQRFVVHTTCGLEPIEHIEKIELVKNFHPNSSPLLAPVVHAIWSRFVPLDYKEDSLQYNSIKEAILFLYAPANKKLLRRCLVALVVAIYTNKLVEECDRYLKVGLLQSNAFLDVAKSKIVEHVCLSADELISIDNKIQFLDGDLSIEISGLFVILVMSLISIDWGFEFQKAYLQQ